MKKRFFFSLLLLLALLLSCTATAGAEARLDFVTDGAGLLSQAEVQTLSYSAAQLAERYDFGVYIVVVDDYTRYVNGGNIEYFAEEVFDSYDLGYGDSKDGLLLALSMAERDYDLYAHGNFGNAAFTDYGKEQLASQFLDNFRRNDWAGGFSDYLRVSGQMLEQAKNGNPVDIWIPDTPAGPSLTSFDVLVSGILGSLISLFTVSGFRRKMKTAVKQTRAGNYVAQGGVKLREKRDDFVNRTVTRQVIRHDSDHGGSRPSGGHFGGTTISGSHGGSHHSGKF